MTIPVPLSLRRSELAVDLGTAVMRVAGAVGVLAAPSEIGRERPLRGGVVVDRVSAAEVLRPLVHRAQGPGLGRPRVVTAIPTGTTGDERAAVIEVLRRAGAWQVAIVDDPIAAAVGSGLDLSSPYAQMIVDVGYGVTDAAIVRSGAIVLASAARVACGDLEQAAIGHVRTHCGIGLSTYEASRLLRRLWFDPEARGTGSAALPGRSGSGIDLATLAGSLRPVQDRIVGVVVDMVRRVPPDVAAELIESGIALSGGGALIPGLPDALARRTGIAVRVVADPLGAVVRGARRMIPTVTHLGMWE